MKVRFMKIISLILLCTALGISNAILAQTQVDPMREVEKDNCDQTVEVNYRSQKLSSPDGNISIYFEGILRRVGKKGNYKHGEYCFPLDGRQTPVTTMIIETQDNVKRIPLLTGKSSYVLSNPVSFSPNLKYFIEQFHIGYNGGDGEINYIIYNLEGNYKQLSSIACDTYEGGEYKGFISNSEILFNCFPDERNEIINFKNDTIRKVSEAFAQSAKTTKLYGTISGEMTILKRQVFPARR